MLDEYCTNVANTFHQRGRHPPEMGPKVTGPELQLLIQHDITATYRRYEWFVSV